MSGTVGEPPSASSAARALVDDAARTAAARRLWRGTRADEASASVLNRIAAVAAHSTGVPSAQVSLLTDVQEVPAGAGAGEGVVGVPSEVEQSLCTVTAVQGSPLVVTDATADSRVAHLPPVTSGAVGSYLGVPLFTSVGHHPVGALCVYDSEPREWSATDLTMLQDLAENVLVELERGADAEQEEIDRLIWAMAVDAAGVGVFDWDLVSGTLSWDDRLLELFGVAREEWGGTIEDFNRAVHPDDLPRVAKALSAAVDTCGEFEAEYRILTPTGEVRWVGAHGRAFGDESGSAVRLVGAAYDTTVHREADARVAEVLESMPTAFYSLDTRWRFAYVNAEAERLLGRARAELLGGVVWDLFPGTVGSDFQQRYEDAVATGRPVMFEAYYPAPLNGWYEVRAWPSPTGLSVYFNEITARKLAQERADAAAARAALLADAALLLNTAEDVEDAVEGLADLLVPVLADWASVRLLGPDCPRGSLVDRVVERRTSMPLAVREGDDLAAVLGTPADETPRDLAWLKGLPISGRSGITGVLLLGRTAGRPPIAGADRSAAADLATRAGLALDNARLRREQQRIAEELQRSLLTDPPQPDHVEIVVGYEPASHVAQVGGDWYDAFLQPSGATVLVIGDVVGHDVAAAAAMGQVRGLLRGIAAHTGDGPAEVLEGVDAVLRTLQIETTATAVVARLEQDPQEVAEGVTRLRWSNAGHPPPLVLGADGVVQVLGGDDADLLLGVWPGSARRESCVVVERDAIVLLYTDGLVERRGEALTEGIERLKAVLAECSPLVRDERRPLDDFCDAVLARMLPERRDDDVAVVAVHLHDQSVPRPASAGPNDVPPDVPPDPAS